MRINPDLILISNELNLHVLCKVQQLWHQRKKSLFLTRQLNVPWACLSMKGLQIYLRNHNRFDIISPENDIWTRQASDHLTPSSSQNKPIRDMEAMVIEIHWSLRTRVITQIITSQWTVSTLTPPPPQNTTQFFPNTRATWCWSQKCQCRWV